MMIIRPAKVDDLDSLYELASKTGPGLTTLPADKKVLAARIALSIESFEKEATEPGLENYLFLLEDTKVAQVVGTSALAATVGLEEAFYTYHQGTVVHTSQQLDVHNVINVLYFGNDYTGTTEICTLFLDPDYRKNGNGQLLSRCRFLFMALHEARFADKVIAEMRGYSDKDGNSPFWDAIGSHFFSISFSHADEISGEGRNQFIAELMPKYPIYLPLLPDDAREVIGKTHPDTVPALKMLEKEGFEYRGYVDIFDAGPTIEADPKNIRTIRKSSNYQVIIADDDTFEGAAQYMIANLEVINFRSCYARATIEQQQVKINQATADMLMVKADESLRLLATGR